jgi:hypothetical protein
MQPAEKEVVASLRGTKDELGRVQSVIHEGRASMPAGVISTDEDGVGERRSFRAEIPMQCKHVRIMRWHPEWAVCVQNIRGGGQEWGKVEAG